MDKPQDIIQVQNLRGFFYDSLQEAIDVHSIEASDNVRSYVVNLLDSFTRFEHDTTHHGRRRMFKPLTLLLNEALVADSFDARREKLRALGDTAMFVAGFFARSFGSRANSMDYYIHMGEGAYSYAASLTHNASRLNAHTEVFEELALGLGGIIEALNHMSEAMVPLVDRDVGRLYDCWLSTDSKHAKRLLDELGVTPLPKRS